MPNSSAELRNAYPLRATVDTALCALFAFLAWGVERWGGDESPWRIPLWLIAYVAGGYQPAWAALQALRQGRLYVDILMVVAAIGAACLGDWLEGVILLFLFSLSGTLEAFATYRTNRSIESLIQLRPRMALKFDPQTSQETSVAVESLQVHDRIRVRPGERFPIDGLVDDGETWVDESTLTGESIPIHKTVGEPVYSGTMNGSGAVIVEMTKAIADTTLERIVHLVHEAQSQKTATQRMVESWQQPYVIGVFAAATFVFIATLVIHTSQWYDAFYHAMVLLVVASPCAVVVSSPSVMLTAIARAGLHGVLFKGAAQLETLGRIEILALDKTGTVTKGKPSVTDVWASPAEKVDRMLLLAAAVEKPSEHPLAQPVLQELANRKIPEWGLPLKEFHSHTGQGVHARVDGVWVGVGREGLFESHDIRLSPSLIEKARQVRNQGQTALLVVVAEEAIEGVISVADTLRLEAVDTLRSLKKLGIRHIVMLTGDHERVARAIGQTLGIDEVRAGLLPEEKVTELTRLAKGDRKLAMVGDGVNDAPALAAADVGIAMGKGGTDVALEVADVVLMRDDLTSLPLAIWISRVARHRVRQNMLIAFGTITVLVLSTFFQLPLWLGVLGHEGSTVIVVFNGLRLLWEPLPKR